MEEEIAGVNGDDDYNDDKDDSNDAAIAANSINPCKQQSTFQACGNKDVEEEKMTGRKMENSGQWTTDTDNRQKTTDND